MTLHREGLTCAIFQSDLESLNLFIFYLVIYVGIIDFLNKRFEFSLHPAHIHSVSLQVEMLLLLAGPCHASVQLSNQSIEIADHCFQFRGEMPFPSESLRSDAKLKQL